jgi:hypothetical protein
VIVIDGGIVEDVQGVRVWARLEDGREVLLLICYRRPH